MDLSQEIIKHPDIEKESLVQKRTQSIKTLLGVLTNLATSKNQEIPQQDPEEAAAQEKLTQQTSGIFKTEGMTSLAGFKTGENLYLIQKTSSKRILIQKRPLPDDQMDKKLLFILIVKNMGVVEYTGDTLLDLEKDFPDKFQQKRLNTEEIGSFASKLQDAYKEWAETRISADEGKSEPEEENTAELDEADELLVQMDETRKLINNVVPQNRNFDIEIKKGRYRKKLFLLRNDGEIKDLEQFIPRYHTFQSAKKFIYKTNFKEICFNGEEVRYRGFLLSLFHEIGHSWEKSPHLTSRWDNLKAVGHILKKYSKYLSKSFKDKEVREELIEAIRTKDFDFFLPKWYMDKFLPAQSKSERDAWAFALRSLKKLQAEGYEVFAGFENVNQIKAFIAYSLFTYDLGNKMQMPIFWKSSKRYLQAPKPEQS